MNHLDQYPHYNLTFEFPKSPDLGQGSDLGEIMAQTIFRLLGDITGIINFKRENFTDDVKIFPVIVLCGEDFESPETALEDLSKILPNIKFELHAYEDGEVEYKVNAFNGVSIFRESNRVFDKNTLW